MLAHLFSLGPSRGCRLLGAGVGWFGGWACGRVCLGSVGPSPGGFSFVFVLFLLLFVSFVPLFRPSWLSRSFCFFLPFPSPFSCRCFSWLCSVLWLFAFSFFCPGLPPCRLAFPRFALLVFCFNVWIAAGLFGLNFMAWLTATSPPITLAAAGHKGRSKPLLAKAG